MTTTQEAGRLGAQVRNAKYQGPERSRISQEAAATRLQNDPDAFRNMGKLGAKARHSKSPEEESAIARKAAQTRKQQNPDAFREMGKKGGEHSHKHQDQSL